jgi:hypothetical protein
MAGGVAEEEGWRGKTTGGNGRNWEDMVLAAGEWRAVWRVTDGLGYCGADNAPGATDAADKTRRTTRTTRRTM